MAKLSELVRGFRANVREGFPTVLHYDGKYIRLNCSKHTNGYVGLATRESKYTTCFSHAECPDCQFYKPNSHGNCELGCIKPIS